MGGSQGRGGEAQKLKRVTSLSKRLPEAVCIGECAFRKFSTKIAGNVRLRVGSTALIALEEAFVLPT